MDTNPWKCCCCQDDFITNDMLSVILEHRILLYLVINNIFHFSDRLRLGESYQLLKTTVINMLEIRLGVWALDHFQCTVACPRVHWATSFLPSTGVVLVGSLLQNFQNSYLVRKPLKERVYLEHSSRWTLPLDLWGFLSKLDLQFHENFYSIVFPGIYCLPCVHH